MFCLHAQVNALISSTHYNTNISSFSLIVDAMSVSYHGSVLILLYWHCCIASLYTLETTWFNKFITPLECSFTTSKLFHLQVIYATNDSASNKFDTRVVESDLCFSYAWTPDRTCLNAPADQQFRSILHINVITLHHWYILIMCIIVDLTNAWTA